MPEDVNPDEEIAARKREQAARAANGEPPEETARDEAPKGRRSRKADET